MSEALPKRRARTRKAPAQRDYTRIVQALVLGTPPILLAVNQIIKTGHDVGWW